MSDYEHYSTIELPQKQQSMIEHERQQSIKKAIDIGFGLTIFSLLIFSIYLFTHVVQYTNG